MSANRDHDIPHSLPIPIGGGRRRSGSVSDSSSDSASLSPPSPLQTPASATGPLPRVAPLSPSTSPVLSYFLAQSPKSPPSTFPFRRGMGAPTVFEGEDDGFEADKPIGRHGRRASAAAWPGHDRFPPAAPVVPAAGQQQDRAAGLLRRLSLGGSIARPPVPVGMAAPRLVGPPDIAAAPRSKSPGTTPTPRKPRRANTLAPGSPRPPRAPSPMGERILKGHFDGFN
ncbi:uncharacterized protein BXZ73DRAFT_96057 [Epithele typhae]|uniref:uncharacterized protein n=1 Tax=Epithele typhae TaxID=378194 RepID=UPI002008DB99|nr:uncharacterized protein BXZ73DRAFT_96057 [Epithele typhae]KAH9945075.1 hypothetical protein BXZ73DRAFT_96057 [Epithele typhae]